ncbi:Peptide ABC transporter ATP-binding protein [Candidatus Desulfarcum epimagneticum]|uniref:Peptide ABC transporter ATP-binding protein n=1 Tax=uncultured Desulfobacteraceae bacterium TaxID=218296 RepID=A0A484HHQ0_9BACT|nr:Peptide ABC transporter ATP-binding protein [uncultured Desulfobacteraceae bacterium]
MIQDIILEKKGDLKGYLAAMGAYVFFDTACLIMVNTLMTNLLPEDRDFRHLLLFVLLLALMTRFYIISRKKMVSLLESVLSDIRGRTLEKVRRLNLESFEKTGTSRFYNAIALDARAISDMVDMLASCVESALLSVCVVVYLGAVQALSFFLVAGVFVLGSAIYAVQIIRFKTLIHKAREKEQEMFDSAGDLLDGFKELRLNREKSADFFSRDFREKTFLARLYRERAEKALVKSNVASGFFEFIVFVPILFVLPAFKDVPHSAVMITVAVLLFIPFYALKDTVPYIVRAWVSVERIVALGKDMEKMSVEQDDPAGAPPVKEFREIQYRGLGFSHTDSGGGILFSVFGIDLNLYPGEIVFITGGNGSGKSTLLKMLAGLYIPRSGKVEINGAEISSAAAVRSFFSPVFSDFHLFDRLYGLPDPDPGKVRKWLEIMEIDDKVRFEDGRFTPLDLSTGQKKRLALAVAVMEDRPVCLLDEWAAEQSPRFRKYFYESLLPMFKEMGKTVVAVTHDDMYFGAADRILKLDDGRLAET